MVEFEYPIGSPIDSEGTWMKVDVWLLLRNTVNAPANALQLAKAYSKILFSVLAAKSSAAGCFAVPGRFLLVGYMVYIRY